MRKYSFLVKPASSLCNLRCTYCFYNDVASMREKKSYGIMSASTQMSFIENIINQLEDDDYVEFAFQGGEPTMAGLDYFVSFVNTVNRQNKNANVSYTIQTNGMLINENWCAFFKDNDFLVGLSLDAYRETHDRYRTDKNGVGTFENVMACKSLLDRHDINYNILCTLTREIASNPIKVWDFIIAEKIKYIQFTPCMPNINYNYKDTFSLTPDGFYSFYAEIFPLWRSELINRNYISVKLFDDIINMLVGRRVTACGINGQCNLQFVVEADGSTYPCDFYVLDEYYGGNLANMPYNDIFNNLKKTGFLSSEANKSEQCESCKYNKICGGGCKRIAPSVYFGKNDFCAYKSLLSDNGEELCRIGSIMLAD